MGGEAKRREKVAKVAKNSPLPQHHSQKATSRCRELLMRILQHGRY